MDQFLNLRVMTVIFEFYSFIAFSNRDFRPVIVCLNLKRLELVLRKRYMKFLIVKVEMSINRIEGADPQSFVSLKTIFVKITLH